MKPRVPRARLDTVGIRLAQGGAQALVVADPKAGPVSLVWPHCAVTPGPSHVDIATKRHSCRYPSDLRVLRPPALLRTLLHGVLHPGLACTDATVGRR